MFDIGFMELLLVAIVALLVIGPERMPETVRKVLSITRAVKRSLHNARMDVEREMGLDDIRRQIHNEEILRSLQAPQAAIDAVIKDTQANAQQRQHDIAKQDMGQQDIVQQKTVTGSASPKPNVTPPDTHA